MMTLFGFLDELLDCVRLGAFGVCVQLVGILISTLIWTLHTEGLWPVGNEHYSVESRDKTLSWIFFPLWSADVIVCYYDLIVFSRRVLFHRKIRKSIRQNDLIPFNYYRFSWPAFIGELVYAVSCSLCWFLFKLLLYRKLVKGVQYNLTYAVVFLPLFSAMQLILLTIMIIWCRRNCS
ncbi:hypothetical protein FBUS_08407 [Fasciolopsis buskii]|uniref:Uncharacterized protein n=1 Tax=Fasciolopsis buskii TaxID=27845 RepID=A0A8E0RN73_9TREM|nr:hypothetical protein FBUS_08407 [Fasciolopsis buski]